MNDLVTVGVGGIGGGHNETIFSSLFHVSRQSDHGFVRGKINYFFRIGGPIHPTMEIPQM